MPQSRPAVEQLNEWCGHGGFNPTSLSLPSLHAGEGREARQRKRVDPPQSCGLVFCQRETKLSAELDFKGKRRAWRYSFQKFMYSCISLGLHMFYPLVTIRHYYYCCKQRWLRDNNLYEPPVTINVSSILVHLLSFKLIIPYMCFKPLVKYK